MNPSFLNSASPYSLHQQMIGYIRTSPIHLLLGHLLRFSTPLGVVMALGEVAVGLGIALGLWTRIAAIGGMLISLSLFLAVSFHSHPWYTGADIVYFFMFTPFVVAGAGGVLSVDALIARRAAREEGLARRAHRSCCASRRPRRPAASTTRGTAARSRTATARRTAVRTSRGRGRRSPGGAHRTTSTGGPWCSAASRSLRPRRRAWSPQGRSPRRVGSPAGKVTGPTRG